MKSRLQVIGYRLQEKIARTGAPSRTNRFVSSPLGAPRSGLRTQHLALIKGCRIVGVLFCLWLLGTVGFAQSAFQGITPGVSTRNEVANVLGQPVRTVSASLSEYAPPAGIARVEVEYRAGTEVVERLEIYLLKPIVRSALLQRFNLPEQADAQRKNATGNLVEYFGGSSLLALTYASPDVSSGISQIGYYSRNLFQSLGLTASGNTGGNLGGNNLTGNKAIGTVPAGSGATWAIPVNTVLPVQMITNLSSKDAEVGQRLTASLSGTVSTNGRVIIPSGTVIEGHVTQVEHAKRPSKPGMIAIDFDEVVFANGSRAKIVGTITSANAQERAKLDEEGRAEADSTKRKVVFIGSGVGAGVALGAISGAKGAAVGAAAGAAAGIAVTLLAKGPEAKIPTGLVFGIQLSQPLIVRESFLSPTTNNQ